MKDKLINGIVKENPLFVSLLGLCPSLATTKTVEEAFGMGFLFTLVLISTNILISLIRKIIPSEIKIPVYIIIIASFTTLVKIFTEAFFPVLYQSLGVYLSLIVVNCIIMGRAEAFASKNNPLDTALDSFSVGIGFLIALVLIGFIREVFGTGGITIGVVFPFIKETSFLPLENYKIILFQSPPGGFLALGIILGIISYIQNRKEEQK